VFVGGTSSGNYVTVHTNSVINHNVHLSEWSTTAACSFVIKNVASYITVMGNPAKKIFDSTPHKQ